MQDFRYFPNVSSLKLDRELCIGCGLCTMVCPHGVLELTEGKAELIDRDGCMECGACAHNCPAGALDLDPGVGCAALIIKRWLTGSSSRDSCSSKACC